LELWFCSVFLHEGLWDAGSQKERRHTILVVEAFADVPFELNGSN
jgi:hypothetical protein